MTAPDPSAPQSVDATGDRAPAWEPPPDPRVVKPPPPPPADRPWQATVFGALVLPLSPLLAGVALLGAVLVTYGRAGRAIARDPVARGFGLLGLWMLLGALLARDRGAALLGLFNFLPYFFAFPALAVQLGPPGRLRQLAGALVLGLAPVGILGLGQLLWGWAGPVQLAGPVLSWPLAAGGAPAGRLSSVFEYANVAAGYLAIAGVLGLGLLAARWRDWRAGLPGQKRALGLLAALEGLAAIALLLTHSRNGWGMAGLATLAYAVYLGWHWLLAIAALLGALALGAAFAPPPWSGGLRAIVPAFIWARLNDALYPDRAEATLRSTQWQFAADLALQRPAFGWGLRNFTPLYEAATGVWMGHPHNLWLMLAAETGWPVAIALSGLVGWVMARSWPGFRRGGDAGAPKAEPKGDRAPAGDRPEFEQTAFEQTGCDRTARGDRDLAAAWWLAFAVCAGLHLLDVLLFDARLALLGWLLLAGLWGPVRYGNFWATARPADRDDRSGRAAAAEPLK